MTMMLLLSSWSLHTMWAAARACCRPAPHLPTSRTSSMHMASTCAYSCVRVMSAGAARALAVRSVRSLATAEVPAAARSIGSWTAGVRSSTLSATLSSLSSSASSWRSLSSLSSVIVRAASRGFYIPKGLRVEKRKWKSNRSVAKRFIIRGSGRVKYKRVCAEMPHGMVCSLCRPAVWAEPQHAQKNQPASDAHRTARVRHAQVAAGHGSLCDWIQQSKVDGWARCAGARRVSVMSAVHTHVREQKYMLVWLCVPRLVRRSGGQELERIAGQNLIRLQERQPRAKLRGVSLFSTGKVIQQRFIEYEFGAYDHVLCTASRVNERDRTMAGRRAREMESTQTGRKKER